MELTLGVIHIFNKTNPQSNQQNIIPLKKILECNFVYRKNNNPKSTKISDKISLNGCIPCSLPYKLKNTDAQKPEFIQRRTCANRSCSDPFAGRHLGMRRRRWCTWIQFGLTSFFSVSIKLTSKKFYKKWNIVFKKMHTSSIFCKYLYHDDADADLYWEIKHCNYKRHSELNLNLNQHWCHEEVQSFRPQYTLITSNLFGPHKKRIHRIQIKIIYSRGIGSWQNNMHQVYGNETRKSTYK